MAFPSDLARTKNWGTETLTDSDLEGQFDLIINWVMAALNSSTGHAHDGTSNQGPKLAINSALTIASQAQGDVLYHNGTSWTRLGAGTSGQFLKTQGAAANPTWATVNEDQSLDGSVVQVQVATSSTASTHTTIIPDDNTIPQNTEGEELLTVSITPKSTTNVLLIEANIFNSQNTLGETVIALFQDSTAGALAAIARDAVASRTNIATLRYKMAAGTTSSTTFKIRGGPDNTGTMTFNGVGGANVFGGVEISTLTVTEIKAS